MTVSYKYNIKSTKPTVLLDIKNGLVNMKRIKDKMTNLTLSL